MIIDAWNSCIDQTENLYSDFDDVATMQRKRMISDNVSNKQSAENCVSPRHEESYTNVYSNQTKSKVQTIGLFVILSN